MAVGIVVEQEPVSSEPRLGLQVGSASSRVRSAWSGCQAKARLFTTSQSDSSRPTSKARVVIGGGMAPVVGRDGERGSQLERGAHQFEAGGRGRGRHLGGGRLGVDLHLRVACGPGRSHRLGHRLLDLVGAQRPRRVEVDGAHGLTLGR